MPPYVNRETEIRLLTTGIIQIANALLLQCDGRPRSSLTVIRWTCKWTSRVIPSTVQVGAEQSWSSAAKVPSDSRKTDQKNLPRLREIKMAVPRGFEPLISALTTRRLRPLTDGTNKINYNKDRYRSQACDGVEFDGEYPITLAMGFRLRPPSSRPCRSNSTASTDPPSWITIDPKFRSNFFFKSLGGICLHGQLGR